MLRSFAPRIISVAPAMQSHANLGRLCGSRSSSFTPCTRVQQQAAGCARARRGSVQVVAAIRKTNAKSVVKCATFQAEEGHESALRELCKSWQDTMLARKVCADVSAARVTPSGWC